MTAQRIAVRVKFNEAKRAFENGADILISERGDHTHIAVTPSTAIHNRDTISWEDLVAQVRMWQNRLPNQRYYIVTTINEEND